MCLNHQAKIPSCKKLTLAYAACEIANTDTCRGQYLLKGNLFSNILNNLSEMFLKESRIIKMANDCRKATRFDRLTGCVKKKLLHTIYVFFFKKAK